MKLALKSVVYLVLLFMAVHFFRQFRAEYELASTMASQLPTERGETNSAPVVSESSTNAEALATNGLSAKPAAGEGTESGAKPNLGGVSTNASIADTNLTGVLSTNAAGGTNPPVSYATEMSRHRSAAITQMALFIVSLILLGGLAAWDFARSMGERSHALVFQENEGAERAPEYEAAEQEWSNGNYLEAIGQMREYLKHNPSEQYVALRIAEIYEKDLGNHVAAAMELEEVLGKRLPREKWGWTAIHLANIYSGKLNKPDQALGLLTRIVEHYPETGAAKKARARLGIPDPDPGAVASGETPPESGSGPTEDGQDPSNLPKGFRPKK